MYTMLEACKATGLTYQALKFYCNQGLVPNVKRDANRRRIFDDGDITWIRGLICLKQCGLSIQEIKTFLAMCAEGVSSIPERKQILASKRQDLLRRIDELHEAVRYIDKKQQFYDDILAGKIESTSTFTPPPRDSGQGARTPVSGPLHRE